jgi:glycosyl transferase family 2
VAMMKNEAPYLLEWIAYHRVLGFESFLIYDNYSNDASARILAPLARAGIVDVMQWRDRVRKQRKAYNNARRRLTGVVEWCLYIDLDEFLMLDPGLTLEDLVPKAPDAAGVVIPWRFFGSANLRNRGIELTIERFVKARRRNDKFAKSLVRLAAIHTMHVHAPRHYDGRLLDLEGNVIPRETLGPLPKPAGGPARLHHYFTRSWEEFECKRMRGRGAYQGKFREPHWFDVTGPGEIDLPDALRLAPAVKDEMARLRKVVGRY